MNEQGKNKRIAIVVSNKSVSTTTGQPAGFWWSELTHPYYEFINAGFEVEIFSNDGGEAIGDATSDPYDQSGYSSKDLITIGFMAVDQLMKQVKDTRKANEIDVDLFDAIFVTGGQGPMFTYEHATDLQQKFVEFYNQGKIVSTICHGAAIFKFAKLGDGSFISKRKTIVGFSNAEEDFIDQSMWQYNIIPQGIHYTPWRIEDAMKETGANYVKGSLWASFAVKDGNIITGQQNFSGSETARLIIEALKD